MGRKTIPRVLPRWVRVDPVHKEPAHENDSPGSCMVDPDLRDPRKRTDKPRGRHSASRASRTPVGSSGMVEPQRALGIRGNEFGGDRRFSLGATLPRKDRCSLLPGERTIGHRAPGIGEARLVSKDLFPASNLAFSPDPVARRGLRLAHDALGEWKGSGQTYGRQRFFCV